MTTDFNSFDESRLGGFEESPAGMRNLGFIPVPPSGEVVPIFIFIVSAVALQILDEVINQHPAFVDRVWHDRHRFYSVGEYYADPRVNFEQRLSQLLETLSVSATAQWDRINWDRPNWLIVLVHVYDDFAWEFRAESVPGLFMLDASGQVIHRPGLLLGDLDRVVAAGVPLSYMKITPTVFGELSTRIFDQLRFPFLYVGDLITPQWTWNAVLLQSVVNRFLATYSFQELAIDETRGQNRFTAAGISGQFYGYELKSTLSSSGEPPDFDVPIVLGPSSTPEPTSSFFNRPLNDPSLVNPWLFEFEQALRRIVPPLLFFNRIRGISQRITSDWLDEANFAIREQLDRIEP